jgi:hypothetical protein
MTARRWLPKHSACLVVLNFQVIATAPCRKIQPPPTFAPTLAPAFR